MLPRLLRSGSANSFYISQPSTGSICQLNNPRSTVLPFSEQVRAGGHYYWEVGQRSRMCPFRSPIRENPGQPERVLAARGLVRRRRVTGAHLVLRMIGDAYSYRSASIGSRREALIAGSMPLINPTKVRMTVATITIMGSMIRRMSAASAFLAIAL